MPDSDIYQGTNLVAHFNRVPNGYALEFVPGVSLENGFLATTLKPSESPIESTDLPPFFLNLLPEGQRLTLLLQSARAKDDTLSLLLRLGWDTVGDVAIVPSGKKPEERKVLTPEAKLSESNFWDLFHAGVGEKADSAIPGVQEKISSSTIAFGVKLSSIPSAILKLNPERFPRLVQNEAFFLRVAKSCGINVNSATLVQDRDGNDGLLVERFDRIKQGGVLRKLHQEDACQLLGMVPAHKYEVSFKSIAEALVGICTAPIVEIDRLIRLYMFSYLIGNSDLHAKNISVIWGEAVTLTPGYDLLSTLPYAHLDQHMALKLEGKDANFKTKDFVAFGQRFGVPEKPIQNSIDNLCQQITKSTEKLDEIGFDEKTTEAMRKEILRRIERIRR